MPQRSIEAVLMRGGTSRGLFIREADLAGHTGDDLDALLLELMGTPDSLQVDGLGGGASSTSKVMVVALSDRDDCDVEYYLVQVGVAKPTVDYRPNSGNLSAAVGPYAVDEGLVEPREPVTSLTMYNRNTRRRIRAHVPVVEGRAAVQGDHRVAGIARDGAPIANEYIDPVGGILGRGLLPTGMVTDAVPCPWGEVPVSVVDAGNLVAFVDARDLGLRGDELPDEVNGDEALLADVELLRGNVAARLGLADEPSEAELSSPVIPLLAVVAPARSYRSSQGDEVDGSTLDVVVRVFSMQHMHHAFSMTALICTTVAAACAGTVVAAVRATGSDAARLQVGHPKGLAEARASRKVATTDDLALGEEPLTVTITRTARRLMSGRVYFRGT